MVIGAMVAAALVAATAPTPQATSVSIRDIVQMTDMSGLSVSPDGKLVAFRTSRADIEDNAYSIAWYVAPVDGSAPPRRISGGGGALFADSGIIATQTPIWAPHSNAIYFRSLADGQIQVWRAAADGSGARAITSDAANVRDIALGPDGRSLDVHVGATRNALEDAERRAYDVGVLIDKSVDMAQPIARGEFIDGVLASPRFTGNWFDRGNILWQSPLQTRHIALDTSDLQPTPHAGDPKPIAAGRVLTATIENPLPAALTAMLANGRRIRCDLPECLHGRANSAFVLPGADEVLVTMGDLAKNQTLYAWRPVDHTIRLVIAVSGLLDGDWETDAPCAATSKALVCIRASATKPPELVRVALADGMVTSLFDPNSLLRSVTKFEARQLQWDDPTGTRHGAELILPPGPLPLRGFPLVINYYYCPGFLRGGLGDEVPLLPLAASGIATLCINRAALDVSKPLEAYGHAVSGITTIIDRLVAEHLVDRRRIGMNGLSFGSEITMQMATQTDALAATSISTAQMDPLFYWFNANPERDFARTIKDAWNIGAPATDPKDWKRVSPALNVEKITAPLLMQLPESEARTSMQLLTSLQQAGRPVELYAFANEPHIKNQPRHKLAIYQRNLDWFRYWLEDYEDPATDKSDQYERWQLLRAERDGLAERDHRAQP